MVSCELERSGWKWTKVNQNWNELDHSGPKLTENERTFFVFFFFLRNENEGTCL